MYYGNYVSGGEIVILFKIREYTMVHINGTPHVVTYSGRSDRSGDLDLDR